jgi:hypothetical protein
MLRENDQPENPEAQAIEQVQVDPNDAARRRVMEFRDDELNCEHTSAAKAEEIAADHSARLMEQWDESDPVKNRYLLERVGREMMDVHEAPPPPIHPKELPPELLGGYVDKDFRIDLNKRLLEQETPDVALDTYLHEYRHAEQHYEVLKSHGVGRHSIDVERSTDLEHNQDNYIEPPRFDDQPGAEQLEADYRAQIVESDSRTFAARMTDEILERRDELQASGGGDSSITSDADAVAHQRLAAARGTGT